MSKKTILIIDDEIDLQELIKLTLRSRGYHVEVACNGIEGLEKLKTVNPSLIILDMNMPKMGGLEFYKTICYNDNKPRTPVLVLTARANMEQLFKELNIDGFMAKPFEIDELLKEVETIIERRENAGKITPSGMKEVRKVCIIENDPEVMNQIGAAFLISGYIVNPASNGAEGIERIAYTVPDVAVVNLGLIDIPGDMVILKIKNIAKTQNVKCILYTKRSAEKVTIAEKIGEKEGVDKFIQYVTAKDIVDAVNEMLK